MAGPSEGASPSVVDHGLTPEELEELNAELDDSGTVNEVLAQSIEVARELLKKTPQGQSLERGYLEWLKNHQREAEVITQVRDLVDEVVSPTSAKQDAQAIVATNSPAVAAPTAQA